MLVLLVPVTALLGACTTQGLAFREDRRLQVHSPTGAVMAPLIVAWTAEGLVGPSGPGGADGRFAVFLDRAPMPPGRDLAWLARNDQACVNAPGCPDAGWLAAERVYVTSETTLVIERVQPRTGVAPSRQHVHEITVVLVDADGRRVGEIGDHTEFRLIEDTR